MRSDQGTTRHVRFLGSWSLLVLLVLLVPSEAVTMPVFARRYETSCATCHQAFPRLNAVGESFRLNGYRFPDDELYRKVEPVELGDEAYKRLWPRALWPSHTPRTTPLSIVTRLMAEGDLDRTRRHALTFLFPEEIELVWAANLGDDISVYGDIIYLQKDFGGEDPTSWATLKGWIQFQNLIGHWLNVRVGTVGTQTMGLFTARDANFYGTHYYLYTTWIVPKIDAGEAGLAAFKGNNFTIGPVAGIEANGFGRRWFYAAGAASSDPEAPSSMPPPGSSIAFLGSGSGGVNDAYVQLAWKLGGAPFDRSDEQPAATLTTGAEFWRDTSTTLSFFGYRGRASIRATATDGTIEEEEDRFWRAGVGVQQQLRDLTLGAVWLEGRHDRPYGSLSGEPLSSRAWHVEALYFLSPWLLPYARYEAVDLDLPARVPGLESKHDVARLLVGSKAMIRANVGLIGEVSFYDKGVELNEGLDRTLFVLLAVAF